jgi:hypothetical protein
MSGTTSSTAQSRDISGSLIFSTGELGQAHETAHELLDANRPDLGYQWLRSWLDGRAGQGSRWIHIQWHMLVFELAADRWDSARVRFEHHILPAASSSADALTDAPSALWRLALAAGRPVDLPWQVVGATAAEQLHDSTKPFVALHNLLALAGAGYTSSIDSWLSQHQPQTRADQTLAQLGHGLRAYAAGNWAKASMAFSIALPNISLLGGSRAQNELFVELFRIACKRSVANDNYQPANQ